MIQLNVEKNMEKGNNVTLNFVFARHGEKAGEGEESILTEKGQEQATELGRLVEIPRDGVKVYYSDIPRAKQTAEILMKEIEIPRQQKEKIDDLQRKGFKDVRIHKKEGLLSTGNLDEEKIKTQFGNMANFIEIAEKNIPKNITSPHELASAVAKHIMRYVEVSKKLPSNIEGTLINITHLPTLLSFLKNAIGQEIEHDPINPDGKNFVERIGGPINPAEEIIIKVHRENPDNYQVAIKLREREFSLAPETLQSLAEY